ncbi:hypothetical protein GCWU000342_00305 [Shuttleworthella satelles DSM 14600]|uniref:Uncharacterized protein n=1 Tax=Shuttleworthella satelles DSM 14600 TaxID=626523 RepID=C4G8L0_9FIRM|nr:hypothetical protein GCWU000342_00305 [Shuttleworthia satelles DSM 14600]
MPFSSRFFNPDFQLTPGHLRPLQGSEINLFSTRSARQHFPASLS